MLIGTAMYNLSNSNSHWSEYHLNAINPLHRYALSHYSEEFSLIQTLPCQRSNHFVRIATAGSLAGASSWMENCKHHHSGISDLHDKTDKKKADQLFHQ